VSKPKNGAMHWSVTRPKEQIPRGPEVRSEWYEVREWDDFTGCEKVWFHTSGAKEPSLYGLSAARLNRLRKNACATNRFHSG